MESKAIKTRFLAIETPIGVIRLEGTPDATTRLYLPGEPLVESEDNLPLSSKENYPELRFSTEWLKRYFDGDAKPWTGRYQALNSTFDNRVYEALLKVPFGNTVSYGQLARMAGYPKAARAVGRAMATNPLAILIPCHRVLGSDGSLHGYGGGLPMKKALLEHEGVTIS